MADSSTQSIPQTRTTRAPSDLLHLTKKHHLAASLLAEDDLSIDAISERVGVSRQTLHNWRQYPAFAALVGDYTGKLQAAMLRYTIAKRRERVRVLDYMHGKALEVIEQRAKRHAEELAAAESPERAVRRLFGDNVPAEAATGLLVRQETVNASGMKTVNWSVDTGLMKEIRDLHKQAAQELGQWEETVNLNHGGINRRYILEDD